MKKYILISTGVLSFLSLSAQVPQNIVVEHFTNTVCSTCSSRNVGFYNNLAAHPDVIHLSIHPSSPYPSCVYNQHNVTENDARTNFYGVYGGTPRLVVQGNIIGASVNYADAVLFDPFENITTPIEITIQQAKNTTTIENRIVIRAVSTNTIGSNLNLFVALAEDTLQYTSPNTETVHYNVFRKALTPAIGMMINVPTNAGDSVVFNFSTPVHAAWDFQKVTTTAILQHMNSNIAVQAALAKANQNSPIITSNENAPLHEGWSIYPSPADDFLYISSNNFENSASIEIYRNDGVLVKKLEQVPFNQNLNIADLSAGLYYLSIKSKNETQVKSFIKK